MQGIHFRVPCRSEKSSLQCSKVSRVGRVGKRLFLAASMLRELSEYLLPALAHQLGQPPVVIGEKKERTGRGEFLPLEEHRRSGRQQHSAVSAR